MEADRRHARSPASARTRAAASRSGKLWRLSRSCHRSPCVARKSRSWNVVVRQLQDETGEENMLKEIAEVVQVTPQASGMNRTREQIVDMLVLELQS